MGKFTFRLPDIGEGIAEAEIVAWHVKPGDRIEEDGKVADVMTDKATVEMESPVSGVVLSIGGEEGDMLAIGSPLVVIEVEGDEAEVGSGSKAEEPSPLQGRGLGEGAASQQPLTSNPSKHLRYSASVATEKGEPAPGAEGLKIMINQGCNACHSSDGTVIVGPSYLNLYGEKQLVIKDGKEVTVTVDDDYIKRAIYDPNTEVVKGFPKDMMQSYKGEVTDDDILKIIEYLKTLNDK